MNSPDYSINETRGAAACPSVAAAFSSFHRRTASGGVIRRRTFNPLRGGGSAFVVLALVAFGGGLFLALVSPTTPEATITVAGTAPEVFYARPVAEETTNHDAATPTSGAADVQMLAGTARGSSGRDADGVATAPSGYCGELEIPPANDLAQGPFAEETALFAAAVRLGAVQIGQAGDADSVESGFGAVEVPSIPEPGTGVIIGLCLAALVGSRQLASARRRRMNAAVR